jgi:predicted dehydrogenase
VIIRRKGELKKKGVIVVGTGLIAKFHAKAVACSSNAFLAGVCARSKEKAQKFIEEEELGNVAAYGDLDEAFSSCDVEVAMIATASGAHDEAVFAASRHKVHSLVEKPIAISTARTLEMIKACEKAGVKLGCIFQTRWSEEYVEAAKKIASGELGRITYASVQVPWWRNDEYYTASSWHGTWDMDGGGALINQSIHMIDWLVSLMPEVKGVKAFAQTLAHPMQAEDTASAVLLFEGGAIGHVYGSTASFPGRSKRMEITGTKGTLILGDENAHGTNRPDALKYDQHKKALEAFVASLDGDSVYPIDGYEALKSVALIESIYTDAGILPRMV